MSVPPRWQRYKLGDIGQILGGGTPSTNVPEFWGGGIPWLVPSEVSKCPTLRISATQRTISEKGLATSVANLLPPGTVMMTSRATIGEVVINQVPMATNQGFINVVCDPEIIQSDFLAYWIQQNKQIFIARAHGVTFKEITKSNFKLIPILLPPVEEQRAIAGALEAVQRAKQARQRELVLERERKAALMKYLFIHGTRGEPTKHTEIGGIPESWRVEPLSAVAELVSGGTPSRENADWWRGAIPWASPKDMKKLRLLDTQEHVSEEAIEAGSRLVPAQTIFVVIRGMILAKDVPICLTQVPMAFNQDMKAVLPHNGHCSEFLLYALIWRKDELARYIGTSAHGTRRLSTAAVGSLQLPIPPFEEQVEIARHLGSCETKINVLEREIRLHEELFGAILEELMTGRLSAVPLIEEHQAQ